jgi:hypothetical protein
MAADQPGSSPQPGHRLRPTRTPQAIGSSAWTWGAVGATAVVVDAADLGQQPPIGTPAGGRVKGAAAPVVGAGGGDAQHPAAPPRPELTLVLVDEPVPGHLVVSLANNARPP